MVRTTTTILWDAMAARLCVIIVFLLGCSPGVASYSTAISRRQALVAATAAVAPCGVLLSAPPLAAAAATQQQHRPLEVCLVSVQRVVYWAALQADELEDAMARGDRDRASQLYLEARLGAKAALTGRLPSSGSTRRVYTLTSLQLTGCWQDLAWWSTQPPPPPPPQRKPQGIASSSLTRDCTEILAGIVEFDGLDTLTDPSPRTTLTLAQYTDRKAVYVVKALRGVVQQYTRVLTAFDAEPLARAQAYIQQLYAAEVYLPRSTPTGVPQ